MNTLSDQTGYPGRIATAAIFTSLASLAVVPPAFCEDRFECGQEYRVKTLDGFLIGSFFGLLVGVAVASAVNNSRSETEGGLGGLSQIEDNINTGVGCAVGGVLFGGFIGSAVGSRSPRFSVVPLSALPLCQDVGARTVPVTLGFALSF